MEDLRFRPQQPPRNEQSINPLVSPPRGAARIPQQQPANHDLRSALPRRFTTDSGRVPTMSSMNSLASPPRVPDAAQDYNNVSRRVLAENPLFVAARCADWEVSFYLYARLDG